MANVLKIKAGSGVPTTSDIVDREIAFNRSDNKLYINDSGTIVNLSGAQGGGAADEADRIVFDAQAGEALSKGDVVYISGISGNTPIVSKADADDANKMPSFGLAAESATLNNSVQIVTFGTLENFDTSAFSVGDTVFVSTTAGGLTATAPTGESGLIQNMGHIVRSHASTGAIKIVGAGRTAATPNLNQDKIFLGNASNQSTPTSLSSIGLSKFNNDSGFTTNTGTVSFNGSTANGLLTYGNSTTADVESNLTFDGDFKVAGTLSSLETVNFDQSSGDTAVIISGTGNQRLEIRNNTTSANGWIGIPTWNTDAFYAYLPTASANELAYIYESSRHNLYNDVALQAAKKLYLDGGGNTYIFEESADNVIHYVGGQNKLRFNSTGTILNDAGLALDFRVEGDTDQNLFFVDGSADRVGIGTNSPGYKLDVVGTSRTDALIIDGGGTYAAGSIYSDSNWGMIFRAKQASPGQAEFRWANSADSELMRIDTSGRLLIGDTSVHYSGTDLQVGNTSDSQNGIQIQTSTTGNGYVLFGDGTGASAYRGQVRYDHTNDSLNLTAGYTETVYVKGGNVGIGVASPSTKLHIQDNYDPDDALGYVQIENTNTTSGSVATNAALTTKNYHGTSQFMQWEEHGLRIGSRILTNSGTGDVVFTAGADSEKMRIEAGGNVGIGTGSPSYKLEVNQDANVGGLKVTGGGGGAAIARFVRDVGGSAYVDIGCGSDDPQVMFTTSNAARQWAMGVDSSAHKFLISENSSIGTNDRFCIDDSGNVGIGNVSPSRPLQIGFTTTNGEAIRLDGNASYGATISYSRGGGYNWNAGVGGASSSSSNIPASYWGIEDVSQGNLVRLAIAHTTGNVGIGTVSPSHEMVLRKDQAAKTELSIVNLTSNASAATNLRFRNATSGSETGNGVLLQLTNGNDFKILNQFGNNLILGTNNAEKIRLASNGNLIVGSDYTTNASTKLVVSHSGANGILLNNDNSNTANSGRIFFEGTSTSAIFQSGGALSFRTGATTGSSSGTQKFYIDTSGATVVGNLNVTGNSFMNYGLVVNETANDADFRVEGTSDTHLLLTDAANNRVGIGTASPSFKLSVVGGDIHTDGYIRADDGVVTHSADGSVLTLSNNGTYTMLNNPQGNVGLYIGDSGDSQNYYQSGAHRFRSYDGGTYQGTLNNTGLKLGTGYATQKLEVDGNIRSTGNVFIDNPGSDYTPGLVFLGGSNNPSLAYETGAISYYDNSGTGLMRYTINRSAGTHSFYIGGNQVFYVDAAGQGRFRGASDINLVVASTDSGGGIAIRDSNTSGDYYNGIYVSGNELFLKSNNSERVRIDSGGKVGINSDPPFQLKVNVTDGAYTNLNTIAGFQSKRGADSETEVGIAINSTGDGLLGSISSNLSWSASTASKGNTGRSTSEILFSNSGSNESEFVFRGQTYNSTSFVDYMKLDNTQSLHVDGDVVAYSTSVSDKRLKDNITTIDNALNKVMALRGVEFDWNATSRNGQHDIGLIAQEVEEVIPEVVREKKLQTGEFTDNEKTFKTIDYDKMVGVLIEAIKEQQQQINELKEKLNG